jgi:hypothetical protein
MSLLGEGDHNICVDTAASSGAMASAPTSLLSEEEKIEPCGVGVLPSFLLMFIFSSLDKNQR